MTRKADPRGCRSVDWEAVADKPDWAARLWTAAAIVLILLGFVGGMYLRTSLTGGPDYPETVDENGRPVHVASQESTP